MSYQKNWIITAFAFFILTWILMVLNAVYFHFKYQKKLDVQIMGDQYFDGGMLYNLTRLMLYAHYCLFPARAKRAGVYEIVSALPRKIKFHLLFHWFAVLCGCLIMILYFVFDKFF